MPNTALSEAIKEAYASAPSEQIILHTLELRHPAFVDETGQLVAIRVVRDTGDLWARLESQAPLQAGERVQFVAMGFELQKYRYCALGSQIGVAVHAQRSQPGDGFVPQPVQRVGRRGHDCAPVRPSEANKAVNKVSRWRMPPF